MRLNALNELLRQMPDWSTANCRDAGPAAMFPSAKSGGRLPKDPVARERRLMTRQHELERAVADQYCSDCPIVDECLEYALRHRERDGVWGNTSARERRIIWRERGLGTRGGRAA